MLDGRDRHEVLATEILDLPLHASHIACRGAEAAREVTHPCIDGVAADERETVTVVLDDARLRRFDLRATAAEIDPVAVLVHFDRARERAIAVIGEVTAGELDDLRVETLEHLDVAIARAEDELVLSRARLAAFDEC